MTERSYNGWIASDHAGGIPGGLDNRVVPGTNGVKLAPGVRAGNVATVLFYVAAQLHVRVESGELPGELDEWGYNYRKNRNANNLSCHASGTAFDWNATRHPNNKRGTFSKQQVAEIRKILAEVNGVVRWGGDFSGTKDEMHFEICANEAMVNAAARRILQLTPTYETPSPVMSPAVHETKAEPAPAAPLPVVLRYGSSGPEVLAWQQELWRLGYGVGLHDGIYGAATQEATLAFQRAAAIGIDGDAGPQTRSLAAHVDSYPKAEGPQLPLAAPNGPKGTVETFQKLMNERGYPCTVDGKYGPQTHDAIVAFQREVRLPDDGVGGPDVWTAGKTRPRKIT